MAALVQKLNRRRALPERAAQIDRHKRQLETAALAELSTAAIRLRINVLRAWRKGGDPAAAVRDVTGLIVQSVARASALAHAQARGITRDLHAEAARRTLARASSYSSILSMLRKRYQVTPAEFAMLVETYLPRSAEVTDAMLAVVEQELRQAVDIALAENMSVAKGAGFLRGQLDILGVNNVEPYRFATLLRSEIALGYEAGRLQANQDPDVQELLWGYEYVTVGDELVRPSHAALDGIKLPKDDPRWAEITPPNGYNCRCTTIEIFAETEQAVEPPEQMEQVAPDGSVTIVRPGPDRGWGFNPIDMVTVKGTV